MQLLRVFGLAICAILIVAIAPAEQKGIGPGEKNQLEHAVIATTLQATNDKLSDLRNRLDKTDARIEQSEIRMLAMQSSMDRMVGFVTGGITLVGVLQGLQLILGRKKGGSS